MKQFRLLTLFKGTVQTS
uniref:Uncharacterized protein n=1 Tax=Anguilla anguilla TaxID=7936 RepID=A0A0E9VGN9_ANGAN